VKTSVTKADILFRLIRASRSHLFDPTLAWKVFPNNPENVGRLILGNDNSATKDLSGDADSEK